MKYAFKVTRNVKTGIVTVSGLCVVPDETDEYVVREGDTVQVLHVCADKDTARASRSWEVVAAKFHHFTKRHLAEIMRADIARAREIGLNAAMLERWLGFRENYCEQAIRMENAEPRRTAKLHIFIDLQEKLVARAGSLLAYDMRPYDRRE